jgi:hypothetical protein
MGVFRSSKHDNLPLFDADKLTYGNEEAEAEGAKIPDLTIGLMASDHRAWDFTDKNSERASGFHTSDDVLELFDFNTIQQLQKRELLEFPYECGKRTNRTSTIFPFALWEAKKADSGCSHQSALAQNCVKVKRILKWQRDVANGSKVPWNPLVWVYISIGAQWSVYGCHIQENDGRVEDQYVSEATSFYVSSHTYIHMSRCYEDCGRVVPRMTMVLYSFCTLSTSWRCGQTIFTRRSQKLACAI